MSAAYNIKDLLEQEKECVMVPCIYDCASGLAAKLSGAKAVLLSGGELGESMLGALERMLTADEMIGAVERICDFLSLPMIVDCGPGFDNPLSAYRTSKRLVAAGAKALLVAMEEGMDFTTYKELLRAALKAADGSDCIVIARKNGSLSSEEEISETISQLTEAVAMGANGTMACGLSHSENAAKIAKRLGEAIPSWGFYPDQNSVDGVPDVINEEIYSYGYRFISYHYMMKVAMAAMWEYGLKNMERKNNVCSNEYRMPNGQQGASALPVFQMQRLLDLESEFTGVKRTFHVPGSRKGRDNG